MNLLINLPPERRLHIGGTERKEGCEVLNIIPGDHVDHVGDAANLCHFPDGAFTELYASHVLEHFNYVRDMNLVLKEWCRVLSPGGRLRVSVPDLEVLAEIILDPSLTFKEHFLSMRMMFGGQSNNYDFHQVGFTFKILYFYLNKNGFERIRRIKSFRLFKDSSEKNHAGRPISLNVEAWKRES